MATLTQFQKQNYLNIETFRKNGQGVKTPVWFVEDDGTIFVRTIADSGKVKRIRRNSLVKITSCKVDGTPLGDWVLANAHEEVDAEIERKVNRLLNKKYGLMKKMFALSSILQKKKNTIIQIDLI